MATQKSDDKRPWGKFYWSDWLADEQLVQCSLAAQGLWMRMLCIAAKSDPVGYVSINGEPLDARGIARAVGEAVEEVERLLAELQKWGVYSVDRRGCIYSRRMTRQDKREINARSNGAKGGNPALRNSTVSASNNSAKSSSVNPSDKPRDNRQDKAEDKTQRPEARIPPKSPHAEHDPPTEQGQGRDHRNAMATEIIGEFDDMIAEVWSPAHRRPVPHGLDFQQALDWIDAGATPALCRQAFREANVRMAEDGKDPPRMLKARDQDVRRALAGTSTAVRPDLHDLTLSDGRMAFGAAVSAFRETDRYDELVKLGLDPTKSDAEKAKRAKEMLAEAGHRT